MTRKAATAPAALAYSYLRFSSPEQAKGDSLRRQHELRDSWLARSGATLDTSLTLRDEGVSAYTGGHRENPDRHALATFLELVKRGRIPRGSFLVVESLDRLSREHIRPALTLLLNLIDAGIRIVQLLPAEAIYDERVEPMALMQAIMELSRGHSESRMKSERVGRAWEQKKRNAGKGGPITARAPAWLSVEDNRFVVDQGKASAIKRVYKLAADGFGIGAICKRLNAEAVPVVGKGDAWARSYVFKILSNRAVVGDYQPHTGRGGKRRPEGAVVPGYFPSIVTEDQWNAARAAMVSRRKKGGRPTPRLNLFANLLRDARDGGAIHQANKGKKASGHTLVNGRTVNGAKDAPRMCSFPADAFERSILHRLREINPREILPSDDGDGANRVLALTGNLADAEGRIEKIKAQLVDGGDLAPLVDVLRSLDAKRAAVAEQLAEAKQAAASPLSSTWGDFPTLLQALESAHDREAARSRLRSALRRIIESIHCLFVCKASVRIAAVRVQFAGDAHRDYLIVHKPATGGSVGQRSAKTVVRSLAEAGADGLDLRKRKDAAALAKLLEAADLEALATSK